MLISRLESVNIKDFRPAFQHSLRRLLGQRSKKVEGSIPGLPWILSGNSSFFRDSLDAAAALGAGPSGAVEQEAAELSLQAGDHLAPLSAPHDTGIHTGWSRPCCSSNLTSPAGTSSSLPGNGPPGNTIIPV